MSRFRATPTLPLFADLSNFPKTRYQGSKRRLAARILAELEHLDYSRVLDAFGGTGVVSYGFKCAGKSVTYNDLLAFNQQIGLALIENDGVRLDLGEIQRIGQKAPGAAYADFIEHTFSGLYYTDDENRWLDVAVGNIRRLDCPLTRSMAWFALFQAAMAKRPYNLFHRANLYMRTAEVERSFGNKASWDRGFAEHFAECARQANAAVIDGGGSCHSISLDALAVEPDFDLVYIDPPYVNASGVGVDYRDFYHFLEGMTAYDRWGERIDWSSKHRRLLPVDNPWSDPLQSLRMFERLFDHFRDCIIVVSYRSDGLPTIDELTKALTLVKSRVHVVDLSVHQYALSTRRQSREMLLVAK